MRLALYFMLLHLCFIAVLFVPTQAIHEDEQGLRDWILHFVGHVDHVALHPKLRFNAVYVTSAQGAVAAVSVDNGELQWRKIFSEPRACITAAGDAVFVVSLSGAVHVLRAETGAIETTFRLILSAGTNVKACDAYGGGKVRIAAFDGREAHIFELNLNSEDEEVVARSKFHVGEDVRELHLSHAHLWVVRHLTADRYSLEGAVEIAGVEASRGIHVSSASDAVAWSSASVTHVKNGVAGDVKREVTECHGCSAAVVTAPVGVSHGYVTVKEDKEGFVVNFPEKAVHVPLKGGVTGVPVVLLVAQDAERGAWALVRAPNAHLIVVGENEGVRWERWEGLSMLAASAVVDGSPRDDRFGLSKTALGVSTRGVMYAVPLGEMGNNIRVLVDISKVALQMTAATSIESIKFNKLEVLGADTAAILASFGTIKLRVIINFTTGTVVEATKHDDSLFVASTFDVKRSLGVTGTIPHSEMHFFTVNMSSGVVEGYLVSSSRSATPLWTVRLPFPIVAATTGGDPLRTSFVNHLRVFPNKSNGAEEVRRKFPMRNVLAVAYYEPVEDEMPTLVVVAVDVITGSVLASTRHRNVEGPVHMLIVEHTLLYHFMDVEKMRHCLGVWEVFEGEVGPVLFKDAGAAPLQVISSFFPGRRRSFSSRAAWPPTVVGTVLGMRGGDVATLSVTTSFGAIARKSVLFVFASGRVASIELNRLLAGGQVPLAGDDRRLTHVIIPATSIITYKYRVVRPALIATRPTNLESSCHVLVSGMDLFYVRASSGKEFDLLNSDFKKSLLIALTCGFGVLSLVARYFATRKSVKQLWR